jgi:elongin-A
MPVPTLYELSKTRMIQNIPLLTDIGDLPYSFLAPILRHIQTPTQLLTLESNCPQILGEDGEIWLRFIKRDIPDWEAKPHEPRDPKNWGKVYKKLLRDAEREKAEQEEMLKESMRRLKEGREGNRTLIVEGRTGYDPSMRKWGYGSRGSSGGGGGSSTRWGDPAAPKKTGKVIFDKLRRGVFDAKQARPKATQMPAHLLQERKGVVKQAPARLVRMNENEGPKAVDASRQASAPIVARNSFPHPTLRKQPIPQPQSRPQPQQSSSRPAPEPKIQRASLPAGQTFTAPKLQPQAGDAPRPMKRRREQTVSLFHDTKKMKRH